MPTLRQAIPVVAQFQRSYVNQSLGNRYSEFACKMVVTKPSFFQVWRNRTLRLRMRSIGQVDSQSFQKARQFAVGNFEIAKSSAFPHFYHARIFKIIQVTTGGLVGHTRPISQLSGGKSFSTHQGQQYLHAAFMADHASKFDQIHLNPFVLFRRVLQINLQQEFLNRPGLSGYFFNTCAAGQRRYALRASTSFLGVSAVLAKM